MFWFRIFRYCLIVFSLSQVGCVSPVVSQPTAGIPNVIELADLQPNFKKIDSTGKYIRFPGVTLISPIRKKDWELWSKIPTKLSESRQITDHFALLPVSSYHMTVNGLYSQGQRSDDLWNEFISKKLSWFRRLHLYYRDHPFSPKISLQNLRVGSTLMLSLKLNQTEEDKIQKLAEKVSIQNKIPKTFHITLGHLYRTPTKKSLEAIQKDLESVFEFVKASLPKTVRLEEPQLSYYFDMQKYEPWDGLENVFLAQQGSGQGS